ncbi:hypothetical protein, partial [Klebsiella aerogenes]|uniref:hypothetical protein n=1 Tax=Klebsiella aerogenes TaxID=548 RepID=UPI001954AEFA
SLAECIALAMGSVLQFNEVVVGELGSFLLFQMCFYTLFIVVFFICMFITYRLTYSLLQVLV